MTVGTEAATQPEPDRYPQLWPAGFRRGRSCGVLKVSGVRVTDIANEYGKPAFVLDEEEFWARARVFIENYDDAIAGLCVGVGGFFEVHGYLLAIFIILYYI